MQFVSDNWAALLFAITTITVMFFFFGIIMSRITTRRILMQNMFYDRRHEWLLRDQEKHRPEQEELAAALKDKKGKLLKLPNVSFHYIDEERVRDFYSDYFREPTVESMVRELVTETSGEIKGTLPQILESKVGGSNLNKWISTIKLPETSLNGMFLKYQQETLKNNQVILDLELLDVELSDVDNFQKLIEKLKEELEFDIKKDAVEKHINRLKERAADRTMSKLESARGWAIIMGSFNITQEDEFYCYRYEHPVNQYLVTTENPVTIEATIPVNSIQPHVAGNYKQSIGSAIPATIYGEVWQPISRDRKLFTLKITPLAIY